jgi:hypothetical protein
VKVIHVKEKTEAVPYCLACVEHHKQFQAVDAAGEKLEKREGEAGSALIAALVSVAVIVLCLCLIFRLPEERQPFICCSVLFVLVLLTSTLLTISGFHEVAALKVALAEKEATAKEALTGTCAAERAAVDYEGWEGTIHSFHFWSDDYALLFAEANRKKIV